MELRCIMCGRKEAIDTDHKDYEKFMEKKPTVYICTRCQAKTLNEAKEGQKPVRPI